MKTHLLLPTHPATRSSRLDFPGLQTARRCLAALCLLAAAMVPSSAIAANSPPNGIAVNFGPLSIGVPETTLGTFVVADPDPGQTHTCALVAGPDDTDIASFQIFNGTNLKLQPTVSLELKNYYLRVRATDNGVPAESAEFLVTLLFAPITNTAPSFTLTTGETWTPRPNARVRTRFALASSADGLKLVAAEANGKIFTSTGGGNTWAQRAAGGTGNRTWGSLASPADGLKLAAGEQSGGIYTSVDGGASWVPRTTGLPGTGNWRGLASSADGTKLMAANNGGSLYTSTDGGATWTQRTSGLPAGSPVWQSVASSTNGQLLAAVARDDRIYTSTNGGANWVARDSARKWSSIASSADGTRLVAVENDLNGRIHTSTDSGTTWTEQAGSPFDLWWSVASSADGSMLAAVAEFGLPCISWDGGTNWTYVTDGVPGGLVFWAAIASSSDGRRLVAANKGLPGVGGLLYTSEPGARLLTSAAAQPWTVPNFAYKLSPEQGGSMLDFQITTDNGPLFDVPPALNAANGTLTFTTKANAIGNATVTVRLHNDGGTDNGGVDLIAPQTFLITVLPGITNVTGPPAGSYLPRDTLTFTVTYSSAVTVSGAPQLVLLLDNGHFPPTYDPATSTSTMLKFKYVVQPNDLATTGVYLSSPLELNGGTIRSGTFDAGLTFDPPDTTGVLVLHRTTTAAANANAPQSAAAQNVTLTATVTNGTVNFQLKNGADNVGTAVTSATVANGAASVTYSLPANTPAGTYTIVATYQPATDSAFAPSSDNTHTLTVASGTPNVAPSFTLPPTEVVAWGDNFYDQTNIPANLSGVTAIAGGRHHTVALRAPSHNPLLALGSGAYTQSGFASSISPGPANESGQTVTFTVVNNTNAFFSVQPAIAANGTLTFTPVAGKTGTAIVTVTAVDSGPGTAPDVNTSAPQTFFITVAPNAAPRVTVGQPTVAAAQTAGAKTVAAFATFSPGPYYEASQTLVGYTVTADNTALFTAAPAIGNNDTLTFTPASGQSGSTTITVVAQDNGGTTGGGVDKSTNRFTITVVASAFVATTAAQLTTILASAPPGTTILLSGTMGLSSISPITKDVKLLAANGATLSGTLQVGGGGTVKLQDWYLPGVSITVRRGGRLSGRGHIGGRLDLDPDGEYDPGDSPGTITAGSSTWADGAIYDWEINNASGAPGTTDLLVINNALTVTATPTSRFIVRVKSLTAANAPGLLAGFDARLSYAWTIAQAGSVVGFNASAFTLDTSGFANPTAGGTFGIALLNSTNLVVTFTPPPPRLLITRAPGNVTVKWADTLAPFSLESTATPQLPASWTPVSGTFTCSNGTNSIVVPTLPIPSAEARQFFRFNPPSAVKALVEVDLEQ